MKATTKKIVEPISKGICLSISGLGVGWLVGLSVSPIIHIIITSLIALTVSVTSALAGLKVNQDKDQPETTNSAKRKLQVEVNPVPMMLMIIGLALGASLGIYGRTNGWLGPNPGRFAQQWKDTGLDQKETSRRLFDILYPPLPQGSPASAPKGSESVTQSNSGGSGIKNSNQSQLAASTNNSSTGSGSSTASNKGGRPPESSASPQGMPTQYFAGVLFSAASPDDCLKYQTTTVERLNMYLTNNADPKVSEAAKSCQAKEICLKALVGKICSR